MGRSARTRLLSPAVAVLLLAGCSGGGQTAVGGGPDAAGVGDPLFPTLGNGGYDVRHYLLTLEYDPGSGRLAGTAEILARATRELDVFHLDLHRLSASEVTVDGAGARTGHDGDELAVRPAEPVAAGRLFRTVVRYAGAPSAITDADGSEEGWLRTPDGALAVGEPMGSMAWFPGNHHPSDKATYDLSVTVPEGLEAVSNGEPAGERTSGGRTTFGWRSKEPMASYLATLAIGRFEVGSSRTRSGVPVVTAVDEAVSESLSRRIPEALEWAEGLFGPYPFSSAGAIVVPDEAVGYALETQSRPVFPAGSFTPEILAHEIAHQWFGDSVTPSSWRDMWLNEGFATYAEWLWAEEFGSTPVGRSFDRAFADSGNWDFPPARPPSAARISDDPVYERGAMVLHRVRLAVGDEVFFRLLRGWAREHRHGNASTADFTAYAERVSARDLDGVWDVWLYGEGRPPGP
ncbi:M1 family metallopeptidase [Streptomyces sp. NPDC020141]|uniref:M1 family metallopeptidase n=1 Tax=Streptomyces sp. NPDC020141 TaxID=3365065 RepID=UPI0037BE1A16